MHLNAGDFDEFLENRVSQFQNKEQDTYIVDSSVNNNKSVQGSALKASKISGESGHHSSAIGASTLK